MNRPPDMFDVSYNYTESYAEVDAMLEALTAEWLIEQGMMPCPSRRVDSQYPTRIEVRWIIEDKTK